MNANCVCNLNFYSSIVQIAEQQLQKNADHVLERVILILSLSSIDKSVKERVENCQEKFSNLYFKLAENLNNNSKSLFNKSLKNLWIFDIK